MYHSIKKSYLSPFFKVKQLTVMSDTNVSASTFLQSLKREQKLKKTKNGILSGFIQNSGFITFARTIFSKSSRFFDGGAGYDIIFGWPMHNC